MNPTLEGRVLWCYDYEVTNRNSSIDLGFQFTGIGPYYCHNGKISLNKFEILILGDIDLKIPLSSITQLYLGCDDIYSLIN